MVNGPVCPYGNWTRSQGKATTLGTEVACVLGSNVKVNS